MDKLNETISKLEAWLNATDGIETEIELLQNPPPFCAIADAIELLIQGRKAARDIDLYITDIQDDLKKPSRSMRNYERGMCYGLSMAKEILEGKRNHG